MRQFGISSACFLCLVACGGASNGQPDGEQAVPQDAVADRAIIDADHPADVAADVATDDVGNIDASDFDAGPTDAITPTDAPTDAATVIDMGVVLPTCPPGTTDWNLTLASDVVYPAAPKGVNPAHYPFLAICIPVAIAGQSFYLESVAIRGTCTSVEACETSHEIVCHDAAGTQLRPQLWSAENFINGAPNSNLVARMIFTANAAGPVTCNAMFFNHDHGVAGGSITVNSGSTFTASGPLSGTAATLDSGGGTHITSANPTANLKSISGWHMPTGRTRVEYIGDIQVTECHVIYPTGASNPATQCTVAESGSDSKIQYRAQAIEQYPDGTTCHVTDGMTVTRSVDAPTHHKMLYTAVIADHTPGCGNLWRFQVYTHWVSGRSFMVSSGPYGQGMVRPL
jgi:hypothetical protein